MLLTTVVVFALGITQQLGIGDRAPALTYDEIKGNPVRSFSKDKVTVVEFWATWCGPCIENMPHLSQLWTKYKDRADFVGVSVMENDWSKVRPFVQGMGEKMAYPVAIDKLDKAGKGFMYQRWLQAAGQNGIPVAFIVDKESKIAWIGHPAGMEKVLAKVVEGSFDAKAYKAKFDAAMKDEKASAKLINDAYTRLSATPRMHDYAATIKWIDANRGKYDGPGTQDALTQFKAIFQPFASSDYASALQLVEKEPTNGLIWTYFRPMLLIARIDALQSLKNSDWRKVANQAVDGPPDPNMLMAIADAMSRPESKLERDPDIGLKAGEKLASMSRNPMFLVRLVWGYHAKGQKDKAKATLDEAFKNLEPEKTRNPGSYDSMLKGLQEAKAYLEKG